MSIKSSRLAGLLLLLLPALPTSLPAVDDTPTIKELVTKQDAEKAVQEVETTSGKGPHDEYGRSTPRSSVLNLAKTLIDKDFDNAVHYLDLRNLPFTADETVGADLARKLYIVAERAMMIDYEAISDQPEGNLDDGLPSYRELVTTIKTSEGPVDILMQRVPRGDGIFIWKVSNATVAKIPLLDEEYGYGKVGDKLSLIFPHYEFMGLELWQWAMALLLILFGYLFAYIITWLLYKLTRLYSGERRQRAGKLVTGPLRLLITVLFFRATFELIAPSLVARALFEAKTFLTIAIVWLLIGLLDVVMANIAGHMKKRGQGEATVLLKPAITATRIILVIIGFITWLDNMGYEVTTLMAGLGVGGVAVAFAAQRSLENLIGSIMIYSSQPVHVGDFCAFAGKLGVVEEIGLRATRLRTLERTVVHIPNAKFSTDIIENLTQRDKILYRTRLRLALQTTSEQMKDLLEGLRDFINQHEMIDEEASRVRFLEFGEYAQEIELYAYIKTCDFVEYLQHREDINLNIREIIEASGTELALPANTTYLEGKALPASA
ncbi:MAG: mechanosensitive ion channel family protein [Thiotrichales bacterium]|nr:MAG: mechanosensitive ion channel family protein [Thiotrichales bacterium]